MKHLALALAGLLLLAGCISTTDPAGDASEEVAEEPTFVTEAVNRSHSGSINGVGTPVVSFNDGGSDTTQKIAVEANATKVALDVTVDAPPQMSVRVGFKCSTNDQGTIVCEQSKTATADSGVSWSTKNATESFQIAFFWDAGAGEASWTAHVTQHVRRLA